MKLHLPDGQIIENPLEYIDKLKRPIALYPGSFNPLHSGHKDIYNKLCYYGYSTVFEVSQTRVDKPWYTPDQISQIVSQFKWYAPILVSENPTFVEKHEAFKSINVSFAMGYDTASRLIRDGNFVESMKLIIFGRMTDGVYYDGKNLVPSLNKCDCTVIDCKHDISSTLLRKRSMEAQYGT